MILSTLREKAGHIIIIIIGLAIVGFLVGDYFQTGQAFWSGSSDEVANIGGEKISYTDFNEQVQQRTNQLMAQSGAGAASPQLTSYALQQVWRTTLERVIYGKELKRSGLATGAEELAQLLTGDNPHPIARQAFSGPEGYSSGQALEIYRNRASFPQEQQRMLLEVERQVRQANSIEKYIDLVMAGVNVTSLELKATNDNSGKTATANFLRLSYNSIPDSAVSTSDADLEQYYKENSYKYEQEEELRSFEYVSFDVTPSKEDTLQAKQDIEQLAKEFKNTTDDSLFYASNATNPQPLIYRKEQNLPKNLADSLFDAPVGTVYGPYFENNTYKVAKLIDEAVIPDSVASRHILITSQTTPDREERHRILDSLRRQIRTAERSFGEVAREVSEDPGSAERGGVYDYMPQGRFVPEFDHALFFGKEGDLQIVDTQYGTHLVEITGRKNVSRSVKIAVVDRPLEPGQESYRRAYAKANSFVSSLSGGGDFNEKAQEAGVVKRVAENVTAVDFSVPGLANPREVVRWAYEVKLGAVSELFDLDDKYVIARLTAIQPEGISSLKLVRSEVETEVRQQKKGEQLAAKLREAMGGVPDLAAVAAKLGDSVRTADKVTLRNPMVPGAGYEPKLAGSIFGSEPGKLGGPVKGMTGVYAFAVKDFTEPAPVTDPAEAKAGTANQLRQQYMPFLFEALQDKTKIEDNRAEFY